MTLQMLTTMKKNLGRKLAIVKRFVVIFVVFFVIVNVFFANNKPSQSGENSKTTRLLKSAHSNVYDTAHGTKAEQLYGETVASITCSLVGALCDRDNATKMRTENLFYRTISFMSQPLAHPPSSGVYWARDMLENSGFVKSTYAQGLGYSALASYQKIWSVTRNLVYFVMVIIVVAAGFIIMFNVPVGDKASVSLETMIPRLVVTMVLIALSYAIAGFLIDIMYLLMFLVISFFAPVMQYDKNVIQSITSSVAYGGTPDLIWLLFSSEAAPYHLWTASGAIVNLVPFWIRDIINGVTWTLADNVILTLLGKIPIVSKLNVPSSVGGLLGKGWAMFKDSKLVQSAAVEGAVKEGVTKISETKTTIVSLILAIMTAFVLDFFSASAQNWVTTALVLVMIIAGMIFLFFKIYFMLFYVYIELIVSIMFAPFFIMFNALPGSNAFVDWIKALTINLIIFPTTVVLIIISGFIANNSGEGNIWAPPFLNSIADQGSLQYLVALLVLFNIPTFVDYVKESLGYKKGALSGLSFSTMFAPTIALLTGTLGLATKGVEFGEKIKKGGMTSLFKATEAGK